MARNTRTFTDFNLLFSKHPVSNDLNVKTNEDAVKSSLRNLISTKNYERPFHPEIGCQVHSLLFENFTPVTVQTMKRSIFEVVRKFEPRVTILDIKIMDRQDENRIDLDIIFKLTNSDRPVTLSTYLS